MSAVCRMAHRRGKAGSWRTLRKLSVVRIEGDKGLAVKGKGHVKGIMGIS